MALFRKGRLTVNYPNVITTFTDLGGYLVHLKTRDGLRYFIEWITSGGFLHKAGVRANDRLVSVNYLEVSDIGFDNLLDSIRCLMPLMLGLERTIDGCPISVICILDIIVGDDLHPALKFLGFFWNATVDQIRLFIPEVSKRQYSYVGKDEKVFLETPGNLGYWLAAEDDKIFFTTDKTSSASFTKYRYVKNRSPQPGRLPVIYSPTNLPEQCLAATCDDELELESFDASDYMKDHVAGCDRFLNQSEQTDVEFLLESSVSEGHYVSHGAKYAKVAVMSKTGTQFTETK